MKKLPIILLLLIIPSICLSKHTFIREKVPFNLEEQATIEYNKALKLLDTEKAQEAFESILQKSPACHTARLQLLSLYKKTGQTDKIEALLDYGLKLDPQNPEYIKQKALLQLETNNYSEALSTLLKMPSYYQNDMEYKSLLALVYFNEEAFDLAQKHYKHLLQFDPQNSRWWLGAGITCDAMGRHQEALDNFYRAYKLGQLDSDTIKYVNQRIKILQQHIAFTSKGT